MLCYCGYPELPVYVYHYLDLIKSGGVQIEGLKASAIARRKPLGEPVLEKYEFFNHISNQQVKSRRIAAHKNFFSITLLVSNPLILL